MICIPNTIERLSVLEKFENLRKYQRVLYESQNVGAERHHMEYKAYGLLKPI